VEIALIPFLRPDRLSGGNLSEVFDASVLVGELTVAEKMRDGDGSQQPNNAGDNHDFHEGEALGLPVALE
jgi:hypothetical protein